MALFVKGKSGNPGGRPKKVQFAPGAVLSKREITALARSHAPAAIETLVKCLNDPRHRVAAAATLLDRGYGKPQVEIAGAEDRPVAIQFTWAPAQQSDDVTIDGVTKPVIDGALAIAWDRDANGAE